MEYNVRGSQHGVRMYVVCHMGPILIVNKTAFLPDFAARAMPWPIQTNLTLYTSMASISGQNKTSKSRKTNLLCNMQAQKAKFQFTCAAYCRNQPVGGKITQAT